MRKFRDLGKSILVATIPGAVLPILFWNLFSLNTSATARDILPALDNPLEVIGFIGSLIFASPVFIIFVMLAAMIKSIHEYGLIVPIYDLLSPDVQSEFLLAIGLGIHVLLWSLPVALIRRPKSHLTLSSSFIKDKNAKT